jgi:predicted  nucleic acid-binding Zn-ribbon protein
MVWTLKKDDHPDYFEFVLDSLNKKDLKTFHYFNQRLADLTNKREKVKYGYLGDDFFMYMESDLEQKIENKPNYRANKNYLIQYVTPFFNIIVEGMLRAKEQKVLIGVYDYSQSGFEEYLPLFDEDFNEMNRNRIESIKCPEGFYYKFNIDFLKEHEINPFYIKDDEKYFLLLNEPSFK